MGSSPLSPYTLIPDITPEQEERARELLRGRPDEAMFLSMLFGDPYEEDVSADA